MQDGAAGKMAAGADEGYVIGNPMAVAGPRPDAGVGPRHPLAIIAMQIHRHAAKSFAPVRDRAIVMRMRNGDRLQAAERADMLDRFARGQGDAVPHHAAVGFGDDQRAWPDREARLEPYPRDPEIVAPDNPVTLGERLAREPFLALPSQPTPLVPLKMCT